jgi:hypothetical protein
MELEGMAVLDGGEHGTRDDGEEIEVLKVLCIMQGREVVVTLVLVHDGDDDDELVIVGLVKSCLLVTGLSATFVTLKVCD